MSVQEYKHFINCLIGPKLYMLQSMCFYRRDGYKHTESAAYFLRNAFSSISIIQLSDNIFEVFLLIPSNSVNKMCISEAMSKINIRMVIRIY